MIELELQGLSEQEVRGERAAWDAAGRLLQCHSPGTLLVLVGPIRAKRYLDTVYLGTLYVCKLIFPNGKLDSSMLTNFFNFQ